MAFHTIHVKNQPMSFVLVGEHFWQAKLANYNPKLKRHFCGFKYDVIEF